MGQIESQLPGAKLAPFQDWDGLFLPSDDLKRHLMQYEQGDYVFHRSVGSPDQLDLLIRHGRAVVQFVVTQQSPSGPFVFLGNEHASIHELLASVLLQGGIPYEGRMIPLRESVGKQIRHSLTHLLPMLGTVPWYVNNPSYSAECKSQILAAEKGSFLLRADSQHKYTLIVGDVSATRFVTIEEDILGHFYYSGQQYKTLFDLMARIKKQGVPGPKSKLHLKKPLAFTPPSKTEKTHMRSTAPATGGTAPAVGLAHIPAISAWYAGPVARNVAASGLLHLPSARTGDYLFHQNPAERNAFYLSVNDSNEAMQYKVIYEDGDFVLGGRGFSTLDELHQTVLASGLKGQQGQVRLNRPVASLVCEFLANALRGKSGPAHAPLARSAPSIRGARKPASAADTRKPHLHQQMQGVSLDARAPPPAASTRSGTATVLPLDTEGYKMLSKHAQDERELEKHCRGRRLNRFRDILPNPTTRVRLSPLKQDPTLEYINANYVRGYGGRNAREYVAAQAPLDTGLFNFWRMIMHVKCSVIAMVTGLVENGRDKCERYWPKVTGKRGGMQLGPPDGIISIEAKSVEHLDFYVKTMLEATYQGQTHTLCHMWYNTWPDHGVPTDAEGEMETQPLIELLKDMHKIRARMDSCQSPALVHCSAGIGRTGTLISIDHAMHALQMGEPVDLVRTIGEIREDRMAMVQHVVQYKFAYQAIVSYAAELYGTKKERPDVYALARASNLSQFEHNPQWKLHSEGKNGKIFTLSSGTTLPAMEDDFEAVFAPSEQIEQGEVITSPRRVSQPTGGIEGQSWFRSNFTQPQVDQLLADAKPGSFIVRNSSRPGHFALSVQSGGRIVKLLIVPCKQPDGRTFYQLGTATTHQFESVVELVENLLKDGIASNTSSMSLRLIAPADSQDDEEA